MLMVIFGAGASYDSIPAHPPHAGAFFKTATNRSVIGSDQRLPLANELFADRTDFARWILQFERCQPIIPLLRKASENSMVEGALENLQKEAGEYPERFRQLAAIRYYLHGMLWECDLKWQEAAGGVTNYKTLLDQIQRWRKPSQQICLVTFNYDRMLETALTSVGINIQELRDYIGSDQYKVIKVHGSVNWAREVNSSIADLNNRNVWQVAHELIDRAPDLDISEKYSIVREYPIAKLSNQALFPALAIPVEAKRQFECPEEHLAELCEFIPKVTKILIVGWRATEEHFLKLLRDNLSMVDLRIMAVSGSIDEANKVGERIEHAGINCKFEAGKRGFTEFIENREGDDFLKI